MVPFCNEWANFTPQTDAFSESDLAFHIQHPDQRILWRQTHELDADHCWYLPQTRY